MSDQPSTRPTAAVSAARHGWRYLLGAVSTAVPITSPADGVAVIATAVQEAGEVAPQLRADLRDRSVQLELRDATTGRVGPELLDAAERITAVLTAGGHVIDPNSGPHPVQAIEIGIDTMDLAVIRPFWQAVMGYVDDPADGEDLNGLVDPLGQGPSLWFQDMDAPRPQRNRLHFDVTVGEGEAEARIAAALQAGGRLLSDARAKAFWVLADADGNEVCICTWQDRD